MPGMLRATPVQARKRERERGEGDAAQLVAAAIAPSSITSAIVLPPIPVPSLCLTNPESLSARAR